MPAQTEKSGDRLTLTGEKLSLSLNLKQGVVNLARVDGRIKLGPALFWAGFKLAPGDKKFLHSTMVIPGEPEICEKEQTPLGPATVIKWPVSLAGCNATWEIAFYDKEDFAAFRVRLANGNQNAIEVDELSPFAYRGAGDGLEMGAGYAVWKFYRFGYQSWTPAGAIDFSEPQPHAKNFLARRLGLAPFMWKRQFPWVWSSEWMAEIVEPELDVAALLGFVTSKAQTGVVEAEVKYERFRRYEAIADCEGAVLKAGAELASEWAVAMLTDAPRAGQKKYFDLWARAMDARKPKPVNGWCSWYYYFEKIDQAALEKNLEQAGKLNPPVQLFQLDDGYQNEVGDWLNWNRKFSIPRAALADKIHSRGYQAGIWIAPFLASASSDLYRYHKDWFLKNERARPVLAMVNPRWSGYIAYAIDVTHPEYQKWLKDLVTRLVKESKYDFLKLDFIYAACLPGKRYDPTQTGAQALRKGLEIVRAAAGEQTYILGCGSPFGPAIGLVDGMRVSQDTERKWSNWMDAVFGINLAPALQSCFKNSVARSLTSNRLWALDPDCLLLSKGKLTDEELKSQLAIFYLLGGQVLLSEDLGKLSAGQLDSYSRVVPASARPAEPIDLFDRPFPQELFCAGEKMSLLALFNWSEQTRPCKLNLLKYGLQGRYNIFEFDTHAYHGEAEGRTELGKIYPHGVRYFALTEVSDKPQLLGLDFHLGMGQGYAELKATSAKITVSLNLPGKRKGSIYIKMPAQNQPKVVPVEFENSAIIEI